MSEYLKMAEILDVESDDFEVKLITALRDGHFVQDLDEDDSKINKLICHAVKHHDNLVSKLEVTAQALIDSCGDVVKLKKEIERLSSVNAEIIDAIDSAVSSEDMQPVRAMRKKYIVD